jgi:precorrin-2 dehydrogenase/sirohydrochlorin ferrochelatase
MYPIILNLQDRLCVVVGGGSVGWRKAAALLEGGGRVRLVCLEPQPDNLAPGIEWRSEPYHSRHLEGAALVFAAATPSVNRQVIADARSRNIWVNAADDPSTGDFLVPATLRRGDFLIAVSTGGAAPLLAQAMRDQLAVQFDEAFGTWAALLAEFRPAILARVPDAATRQAVLERLVHPDWLDRLRGGDVAAVRRAMQAEVERLVEQAKNWV